MSDGEDDKEWKWESAGFGRKREQALIKEIGPKFEDFMSELEEEQAKEVEADKQGTAARRKLMEHATVQTAQYKLLYAKNARFLQKKKDYKYYELPRLYIVRPVMTEKMMVELLDKNQILLNEMTELVAKNEKIAALDAKELAEYAE